MFMHSFLKNFCKLVLVTLCILTGGILILYLLMCLMDSKCTTTHVLRPEDTILEVVLSLHFSVGSGVRTYVIRTLQHLYTEPFSWPNYGSFKIHSRVYVCVYLDVLRSPDCKTPRARISLKL